MKILLAPTYELAKDYATHNRVDATVEAEYGEKVIEGEVLTLAHHGMVNDPRLKSRACSIDHPKP